MNSGAKRKNVRPETSSAGRRRAKPARPPISIVAAASRSPRKSAPPSPMMIRAGWKLCGRNPIAHPAGQRGDQRAEVVARQVADVDQPDAVDAQRSRGDRHDAGGEAVEAVDEVDRIRHRHDP